MTSVAYLLARQECPSCGKRCYRSRRGARTAAHALYPSRRLAAYQCGRYWHLTSSAVRRLRRTARERNPR